MDTEAVLDGLRNKKSGRVFILVEDGLAADQVRVINVTGNAVLLSRNLFEEEPVSVQPEEQLELLTPEQLEGLQRFRDRQAEALEKERQAREEVRRQAVSRPAKSSRRKSSRTEGLITKSGGGGIVDRWTAPKLTFYRHRIGPLRAKDRFAITVSGRGVYIMSKEEFEREFNDVVMSKGYRAEGYFSYPSPPERAERFLKSSS